MKKLNKKTVLVVSVLIILAIGIWILWSNTALEVNEYEIVSERIPEAFSGFRIAQVSDLHNKDFGEGYGQLLRFRKPAPLLSMPFGLGFQVTTSPRFVPCLFTDKQRTVEY